VLDSRHFHSDAALRQAEDLRELVLRELVLRYLAEHPGATDTLEGIAEWWITREQLRVDMQRLTKVLAELVQSRVLEESGTGDGRLYRLRARSELSVSDGGGSE
jgi:hypothetical protein